MAKPLVIVESRAKAKTIAGFLGRDRYTVMASVGHIRDLPHGAKEAPKNVTKPEVRRLGIDVDDHFRPIYVVPDDKKHVVAELQGGAQGRERALPRDRRGPRGRGHLVAPPRGAQAQGAGQADGVPRDHQRGDRRGHRQLARPRHEVGRGAGGSPHPRPPRRLRGVERRVPTHRPRHVGRSGAERRDPPRRRPRARPHGVPQRLATGISRARSPRDDHGVPRDARHARRQAPRVGPRLRRRHRRARSRRRRRAPRRGRRGRARRPARRPAVHRRVGRDAARVPNARRRRSSRRRCSRRPAASSASARRARCTSRRASTSAASSPTCGPTPPRSPQQAVDAARDADPQHVRRRLPARPASRTYRSKVKNAQEAHEAIRPAGDRMRTADDVGRELSGTDERRLYDLIWKRTVARQMADARIRRVTLRLAATSTAGEEAVFQATGRTIEFPGYLRAYVEGADDPDAELEDREAILPAARRGRRRSTCDELQPSGHTTQPPARYTEASLVKELEERGIGRPSTYASVIDTILTSATTCGRRAPRSSPRGPRSPRCSCSSATSRTSSTTSSPPPWRRRSTRSRAARAKPRSGCTPSTSATAQVGLARARVRGAPRADRHGRGQRGAHRASTPTAASSSVRVWPNGAQHRTGRREGARSRPTSRPTSSRPSRPRSCSPRAPAARASSAPIPTTGLTVLVLTGRFGPFVQLGELERRARRRSRKRASLFASMDPTPVDARGGAAAARRCRASSGPTPRATRSPRRTGATGPT